MFANPLMNAAYICSKTLADTRRLALSTAGAVVVGSISVKPRKKNAGQNYWRHKRGIFDLNSFGMPNGGLPYFKSMLPKMEKIVHAQNKPLIVNVVGFSKFEFAQLTLFAQNSGADIVELNFGCPNVWHKNSQEHIISYHPELVKEVLDYLNKQNITIPVSVKISPLSPDTLKEVSEVIANSKLVKIVTATNSYPNAAITSGANDKATDYKQLVGLTGPALKPISLGVVHQLRTLLPDRIQIIGCGGISTATDVRDFLNAGASGVQIASGLLNSSLSLFDQILNELRLVI